MTKQDNKDIFLVAYYTRKPKPGVNTSVAGWQDVEGNVQWDESVEIVRGLKKKTIDAKIILNLSQKKVKRNFFSSEIDFDKMFTYFFEGYSQYITTVMTQLDSEYLLQMIGRMESELKEATEKVDAEAQDADKVETNETNVQSEEKA